VTVCRAWGQHTHIRMLLLCLLLAASCCFITVAAAGMALPLCLDRLVNVVVALVLSTTAIVLFGECYSQHPSQALDSIINDKSRIRARQAMFVNPASACRHVLVP